ncbi:MAG: hypothetical protein Q7S87_08110 [Agitococcus sp.]|nr:hypothetical protein [Agitococcus sp.]
MKKISLYKLLSLLCVALYALPVWSMSIMNDGELSTAEGQSLVTLSYLAPTDAGNFEAANNVGFYKLGFEAEVAANLNIKKLQLGCGGVNGAGDCDIDIDNLSLSGNPAQVGGTPDTSTNRNNRVQSSAILTNPFFQFAIENPTVASTRKVVGFRFGSESATGLLTLGTENTATPNGINTLSGYMNIGSATGTATTQARSMTYSDVSKAMTGRVDVDFLGIGVRNFASTVYTLNLASATAAITTAPVVIAGNRMTSANLTGTGNIGGIAFTGNMDAVIDNVICVFGCLDLTLNKDVTGTITGLVANVPIVQDLGFIHKLDINNPFSLSVQGQDVHWPGAAAAAEKGWWMAFEDQINIGSVTPTATVAITNAVLSQALGPVGCSNPTAPGINCTLYRHYRACPTGSPDCGGAMAYCSGLSCFGGSLPIGTVNVTGTTVDFPLSDLQLSAQSFTPNCYGTLKFC